jgi:hypothetical protein
MAAFGKGGRGRGWDRLSDAEMKLLKEKFIAYAPRFGSTGYASQDKWLNEVFGGGKGRECRVEGTTWAIVTAGGARVKGKHRSLAAALEAYRALPEADRKPEVANPGPHNPKLQYADVAPSPGTLFVNVYCRVLEPAGEGRFRAAKKVDLTEFGGRSHGNSMPGDFSEPQRECLWLAEPEWKALMPATPKAGDRVAIPESVRQRVLLFYVFNWYVNSGGGYWAPKHLRDPSLELTVQEASEKTVRLRLSGRASYKGEAAVGKSLGGQIFGPVPRESGQKLTSPTYRIDWDVRIEGVLEYDPGKGRFSRFDAVALGDYQGPWGLSYKERPVPVGVAFELDRRDLAPERRHAPYVLSALREHYWNPEKWKPRD